MLHANARLGVRTPSHEGRDSSQLKPWSFIWCRMNTRRISPLYCAKTRMIADLEDPMFSAGSSSRSRVIKFSRVDLPAPTCPVRQHGWGHFVGCQFGADSSRFREILLLCWGGLLPEGQ